MSNYPSVAAEAGDKYLEMLAEGQERFVEYVRSAREFMPQVPPQFAAQAPAAQFAFTPPSARDIADAQYKFATKLLKQQESFIRKMYQFAAPAAPAKAKAPASRSSSKSRSTARKTTRRSRA